MYFIHLGLAMIGRQWKKHSRCVTWEYLEGVMSAGLQYSAAEVLRLGSRPILICCKSRREQTVACTRTWVASLVWLGRLFAARICMSLLWLLWVETLSSVTPRLLVFCVGEMVELARMNSSLVFAKFSLRWWTLIVPTEGLGAAFMCCQGVIFLGLYPELSGD